jgi:hypothetical protein
VGQLHPEWPFGHVDHARDTSVSRCTASKKALPATQVDDGRAPVEDCRDPNLAEAADGEERSGRRQPLVDVVPEAANQGLDRVLGGGEMSIGGGG